MVSDTKNQLRKDLRLDRVAIVLLAVSAVLFLNRFWTPDVDVVGRDRWVVWGLARFATYTIIPILTLRLFLRQPISEMGLKLPSRRDALIYGSMLALMVPLVFAVSNLDSFQAKYPFFVPTNGLGEMWPWWIAYGLQFIGLEFFFRGFMVHSLKDTIGGMVAVWVMVVPYMMIHFTKPPLEALGAVIAGVVLGVLSLRKESIWLGAALHIGVALTMDITALWQRGLL
jgi:membrane protease YdiL (CAAX protease family)